MNTSTGGGDATAERTGSVGGRGRWRRVRWAAGALLLLIPLVAMQFTDEVRWGVGDFALAAVLLIGVGAAYELATRKRSGGAYRAAVGLALAAALLLVWVNGAVGILGSEDDDANLMVHGVLAIGAVGAFLARFRPRGMARALFATALAQATVAVIALVAGLGGPESGPLEIVTLNGVFVALFVGAAVLFDRAAGDEDQTPPG